MYRILCFVNGNCNIKTLNQSDKPYLEYDENVNLLEWYKACGILAEIRKSLKVLKRHLIEVLIFEPL